MNVKSALNSGLELSGDDPALYLLVLFLDFFRDIILDFSFLSAERSVSQRSQPVPGVSQTKRHTRLIVTSALGQCFWELPLLIHTEKVIRF